MSLTWPNLLSVLRLGLIPLFIISLIDGRSDRALAIFALAAITDALDGAIARFYHQQSVLGAYLDPAADKLLLTAAFVMLAIPGVRTGLLIPVWVTVLVIARDVGIVMVALIVHLAIGIKKFPPSWISKWNTGFQLTTVFLYLLSDLLPVLVPLAQIALVATVVLTVVSGCEYAYRFIYRAEKLEPRAPGGVDGDAV